MPIIEAAGYAALLTLEECAVGGEPPLVPLRGPLTRPVPPTASKATANTITYIPLKRRSKQHG